MHEGIEKKEEGGYPREAGRTDHQPSWGSHSLDYIIYNHCLLIKYSLEVFHHLFYNVPHVIFLFIFISTLRCLTQRTNIEER